MNFLSKTNETRVPRTSKPPQSETKIPFVPVLTGTAIAFVITCIVFIVYALLLTYTDMTEDSIALVVIITTVVSVVVAGFDSAKGAKKGGWIWGMVSGLLYVMVLLIVGALVTKSFSIGMRTITLMVISIASGGVGGMLGINVRR